VRAPTVTSDRPARRHVRRIVRVRLIAAFTFLFLLAGVVGGGSWAKAKYERYEVTRVSYEVQNGRWDIVAQSPVRSIHAVMEPRTGNILLMAGTGNSSQYTGKNVTNLPTAAYKTAVFDPSTDDFVSLEAEWDVFCGGEVIQPDGNILAAGGTASYEELQGTKTIKQFKGVKNSAIFNVLTNTWTKTGSLNDARWYPTIVRTGSPATDVIVSGLDQLGNIDPGHTEFFDASTNKWVMSTPKSWKLLPTYPALFQTEKSGWLFYSGANAGYGPGSGISRQPGLWDFLTGQFIPIYGLAQPQLNETAGTVLLPPANEQKYMFIGGGGVGDVQTDTARTAIVDVSSAHPKYVSGPNLIGPRRYPLATILPDDTVLIAGGSAGYRAKDMLTAEIYNPATNRMTPVASPSVGRDYHSEAILTNSGAVFYFGSNPLSNTNFFEMRVEEYRPWYFFAGPRPVIQTSPKTAKLGSVVTIHVQSSRPITKIRFIAPSAYTHVTDTSQRSVAATILSDKGGVIRFRLPANANLLIPGYYMLFATDSHGVPSVAPWIQVTT
jgi:hypothetical protein